MEQLELNAQEQRWKKGLRRHLATEVWVKLGPSKIEGVGVIAIRDIPSKTNPFAACNDKEVKDDLYGNNQQLHCMTEGGLKGKEVMIPLSESEVKELPLEVQIMVKSFFAPLTHEDNTEVLNERGEMSYGVNATGLNTLDVSWYLNHSDKPNVAFQECTTENGFGTYETNTLVKKGEELTVDYKALGSVYHASATKECRD